MKSNFSKRSRIEAPVSEVFQWHARPGAIERLSPPWSPLEVLESRGGIKQGAEVLLRMKAGPVSYKWLAKHTNYQENLFFRDEQLQGPFSAWIHTHRFEPDGENACFLEDMVEYRLPLHPLANAVLGGSVQKKLNRIFAYRHQTTAQDLKLHLKLKTKCPLNILVSGASGFIGRALVPFLTTGGHRVFKLVRRTPNREKGEIFWDPITGRLNPEELDGIDAVIHLAGENIGNQYWTKVKKQLIVASRNQGTSLLADRLTKLKSGPQVLICASATGYYGNRGDKVLVESDKAGDNFLSRVCTHWENSAVSAVHHGIRTLFMRIGVVLNPTGGALARLLPLFNLGLGGKIGTGTQYISWIGMDDVLGAIYQALFDDSMEGAVNVVSPNPVTSMELSKTVGKILGRPTIFRVPATAIELFMGEMGREVLLASTRAIPDRLLQAGYEFRHSTLDKLLEHVLGKTL